jgi:hypothetical protein
MSATMTHRCYRCEPEPVQDGAASRGALGTIQATRSDGGDEIFFASGYSAREIAQKHAREQGGHIYVNNVSRMIKRPELTVWVAYAVAKTPVYTTCGPDDVHDRIHRVYWRPLDT